MEEKQNSKARQTESSQSTEKKKTSRNDDRDAEMLRKQKVIDAQADQIDDDGEEAEDQPVSRKKKILNTVVNVVLIVAIILAAVCTYISFVSSSGNGVPSFFGVRVLTVQTDSMYPTLLPGDLIIDTPVKDASTLRKGDIITYWTIISGERVLNTHKIINIYDGGSYLLFETKGDNNTIADAMTVHESEIVGKYKLRIPSIGKLVDYLQTATGFFIVVVVPVLLFFIFHLVQFFRVLFEYQNVKMLIKYEKERGKTEDLIESQIKDQKLKEDMRRAALEAELREQLKAELLADMAKQAAQEAAAEKTASDGESSENKEE